MPIFESTQERIEALMALNSPRITDKVLTWLIANSFFEQPASTRFHGSYKGGLFDHSYDVAMNLIKLTDSKMTADWSMDDSPVIVGIFHDLCKTDQYRFDGERFRFIVNTEIKGHGKKSVTLLKRIMDITPEEEACIRCHMGAFGTEDDISDYTSSIRQYPNVLWTHTADMVASHINNI